MTPTGASQAILAKIVADWNVATATLTFEGERFTPPTDAPWIRVSLRSRLPGLVTHGTVGARLAEQRGRLIVQCFAPNHVADGAGASEALAQTFRDLFHGLSLGADPIHFDVGAPQRIGVDGSLFQTNVELTFRYHELI